jgi:hypothetical protein
MTARTDFFACAVHMMRLDSGQDGRLWLHSAPSGLAAAGHGYRHSKVVLYDWQAVGLDQPSGESRVPLPDASREFAEKAV